MAVLQVAPACAAPGVLTMPMWPTRGWPTRGLGSWAEERLAALLEATRGLTILSADFLTGRRLLTTTLTVATRVADLTAAAAYGFGVSGELSASAVYTGPQVQADALQAAGFHGIRYHVRHDPRGDLAGIAWLGLAGRSRWPPAGCGQQLSAELLLAAALFGVQVAGHPPPAGPDTR